MTESTETTIVISWLMERMAKLEIDCKNSYQFDETTHVPRVTEVLSAMLNEPSFLNWANNLGWKRISYSVFMKEASDKGTYTHLAIEKFLKNQTVDINEFNIINPDIKLAVISCFDAFLKWWSDIHTNNSDINVVCNEKTLIHQYFGGTCDCLLSENGLYHLIDFKTSNHMSYNYALQLAAYRFLFRELENIDIDKCTVLMLSKTDHSYKTYTLDLSNQEHKIYIDECEQAFLLLLAAYRMRLYTTDKYYKIFDIDKYTKR